MHDEGEVIRAGFECKYHVVESEAGALLDAVARLLAPDPFGATYDVASLYLDTPDLACYRREVPGKWRLRRYGTDETVYAEFKAKPEPGHVHKRRSSLTLAEAALLPHGERPRWFVRAIGEHRLRPTRVIWYRRDAFVGELEGEAVRLTLDREVMAIANDRYDVPVPAAHGVALTDGRILELKFAQVMPRALEAIVASLGLLPESFSKYRAAIEKAR